MTFARKKNDKNNIEREKIANEEKVEPTTACELVKKMLRTPAQERTQKVGGGFLIGLSWGGGLGFGMQTSKKISSYDKTQFELARAQEACKEGMMISPYTKLSKSKAIFYCEPNEYEKEKAQIEQKEVEIKKTNEEGGIWRKIFPRKM